MRRLHTQHEKFMNKNNEKRTYIITCGYLEDKRCIFNAQTIECIPDDYADKSIKVVIENTQDKLKPFVFDRNIQLTSSEKQQLVQVGIACYSDYFEWVADYLQETRFTAEFLRLVYYQMFEDL